MTALLQNSTVLSAVLWRSSNNAWVELARTIGESGIIDFLAELTSGMATSIGVASPKPSPDKWPLPRPQALSRKPPFLPGVAIKAAYLVVQTSILGLARGVLRSLETIYDGAVTALSILLPGVELKGPTRHYPPCRCR